MKVIKKLNNNSAICLDSSNNELIAFGKGIGFPTIPYELEDLNRIDRTYYGVDPKYINLINELPEEVFDISETITNIAYTMLENELNINVVFTLADHINFALERMEKGQVLTNPIYYDLIQFYPNEIELGEISLKLLNKKFNVKLPRGEAASIALHFINAGRFSEKFPSDKSNKTKDDIINDISIIIENCFNFRIEKKSFNYSRFVSHLQYLLKRKDESNEYSSGNIKLYNSMKEDFPQTYNCMNEIVKYLNEELDWQPRNEEMIYIMLHVNRLCVREDCNR